MSDMTVPGESEKKIFDRTTDTQQDVITAPQGYRVTGIIDDREPAGILDRTLDKSEDMMPVGYRVNADVSDSALSSIMEETGQDKIQASNMLESAEREWLKNNDILGAFRATGDKRYALQMAGLTPREAELLDEYNERVDGDLVRSIKSDASPQERELIRDFLAKRKGINLPNIMLDKESYERFQKDQDFLRGVAKIKDPRVLNLLSTPLAMHVQSPDQIAAIRQIESAYESLQGNYGGSLARQIGYSLLHSGMGIVRSNMALGTRFAELTSTEKTEYSNSLKDEVNDYLNIPEAERRIADDFEGIFDENGNLTFNQQRAELARNIMSNDTWKQMSAIAQSRGIPMPDQGLLADAIVSAPATLIPMAMSIINPVAAGYTMGAQIEGSVANDMLDNNVPAEIAVPAAVAAGVGSGLLEMWGGQASNTAAAWVGSFGKGAAKVTPGLWRKAAGGLLSTGIQSTSEMAQEAWEAGVTLSMSGLFGNLKFEDAWDQFIDRSIRSAPNTAGIAGLYEGLLSLARIRYHLNSSRRNYNAVKYYGTLAEAVGKSNLQDKAPGFLRRLFRKTANTTDAKEVESTVVSDDDADTPRVDDDKSLNQSDLPQFHLDAVALDRYFHENETDAAREETFTKLGITEQQVRDAAAVEGRVDVDFERFMAYAPKKQFEEALRTSGKLWMGDELLDIDSFLDGIKATPEMLQEADNITKAAVDRQKLINLFMKNNERELQKTYRKQDIQTMTNVLFGNLPRLAKRWQMTPEEVITGITVTSNGELLFKPQAKKKTKRELADVLRRRTKAAAEKEVHNIQSMPAIKSEPATIENETSAAQRIQPAVDPRQVIVRTSKGDINAQYKLVERKDVLPSHNPDTLFSNSEHRGGQNRDYSNPETQDILNGAFQPDRVVNTNPTTSSGLPLTINIDGKQHVNAGNLRSILSMRNYDAYRNFLEQSIKQFGFTAEDLNKYNEPYLVREITDEVSDPEELAVITNETEQRGYDLAENAVSRGGFVGREIMSELNKMEPGETLAQFMTRRGAELFRAMQIDGVILGQRSMYYDSEINMLTENGRLLLKYALLGKVVPDVKALKSLENLQKQVFNKLADIAAQLLNTEGANPDYSLLKTGVLKEAVAHIIAKEKYALSQNRVSKLLKTKAKAWEQYATQGTLEGFSNLKPEGAGFELAKKLEKTNLKKLREELDAYRAGLPGATGSMFEVKTPSELLNELLGLSGEKQVQMPGVRETLYSRDFRNGDNEAVEFDTVGDNENTTWFSDPAAHIKVKRPGGGIEWGRLNFNKINPRLNREVPIYLKKGYHQRRNSGFGLIHMKLGEKLGGEFPEVLEKIIDDYDRILINRTYKHGEPVDTVVLVKDTLDFDAYGIERQVGNSAVFVRLFVNNNQALIEDFGIDTNGEFLLNTQYELRPDQLDEMTEVWNRHDSAHSISSDTAELSAHPMEIDEEGEFNSLSQTSNDNIPPDFGNVNDNSEDDTLNQDKQISSETFDKHVEIVSSQDIRSIDSRVFNISEGDKDIALIRNPGNIVTEDEIAARNINNYVAAIIPANASKAVRQRLRDAGLTIYEAATEEEYSASLGKIRRLFFDDNNVRGSIDFDNRKAAISLFSSANRSTFFHEIGHFFWEMDKIAYNNGILNGQDLKDHEVMREWLNDTGNNTEFYTRTTEQFIHDNQLDINADDFKHNYTNWKNGKLIDKDNLYSRFHYRFNHEKFASGFETYLRTGKAPAPRLTSFFERIHEWMRDLYKDIRYMVHIDKEVSAIFDRMLAVESEIKKAGEFHRIEAETAAELRAGETEKNQRKIKLAQNRKRRKQEREAKLYAMATDKWIREGGYQQVKDSVTRTIEAQKVYSVIAKLKDIAIDEADARKYLGESYKEKLEKHGLKTSDSGIDIESLAIDYGYANGQALLADLDQTKAKSEAIDIATDNAVKSELIQLKQALKSNGLDGYHGIDDERAAELITEHNERMRELTLPSGKLTSVQAAAQEKFRQYRLELGAVRQAVRGHIERMRFKNAASLTEIRKDERRAMKELERAIRASDSRNIEKAKIAKAEKIAQYNEWIMGEDPKKAARGKRLLEKVEERFIDTEEKAQKKVFEASRKRIRCNLLFIEHQKIVELNRKMKTKYSVKNVKQKFKGMEYSYSECLSDLYAAFFDPKSSIKPDEESGTLLMPDDKVFSSEIEGYEQDARDTSVPSASECITDWMKRKVTPSDYTGYGDLTVEQVRELDTVMHRLIKEGRNEVEALKIKNIETVDGIVDQLLSSVDKIKSRTTVGKDKSETGNLGLKWLRKMGACLKNPEMLFEEIDNFQFSRGGELGVGRLLVNSLISCETKNEALRAKVYDAIKPHLEVFDAAMTRLKAENVGKYFNVAGLPIPSNFSEWYDGQTMWTGELLLTAALNIGNDASLHALCFGYGWTRYEESIDGKTEVVPDENRLIALQRVFTAEEWRAIQGVWDELNTLFPMLDDVVHRSTGQRMVKEEARAITVLTADGQELELNGGYYPLKYDSKIDAFIGKADKASELKSRNAIGFVGTQKGHRKARLRDDEGNAVVTKPPLLSIGVMTQHINKITRDITHSETVTDVYRVFKDERFRKKMEEKFGLEYYNNLIDWIAFQANPNRQNKEGFEQIMDWMRKTSAASILGFNVKTGIKQRLSLFNAISEMNKKGSSRFGGYHYLLRGMRELGLRTNLSGKHNDMVKDILEASEYMRSRQGAYNQNIYDILKTVKFDEKSIPWFGGKRLTFKDVQEFSFRFIQMNDQATVFPIWQGAYSQAIAEGLNGITAEMSVEDKKQRAVEYADQVVRISQPSTLAPDLSAAQRSTGFLRFTTAFMTFLTKNGNLLTHNYKAMQNGVISWDEFLQHVFENFYLPYWATFLAGYFLIGGDDDDDESIWKSTAMELGVAPAFDIMGTVPIARDLVKYPGNYKPWVSDKGVNIPALRKGSALPAIAYNLSNGEWNKAGYGFLDLSAYMAGVGSEGLKSNFRNAMKVYDNYSKEK